MKQAQRFFAISFLLASTLATSPATASPETDRAEALYSKGKDAMARGDLAVACALLEESLTLDNATGTLLNLATCEERSGKLVSTLERFTTARARLPNDDFRVPFTAERIRELSKRIAHLTIRPRTQEDGLEIKCDGAPLPPNMWNVPRPIDPGVHRIVIERKGRPPTNVELRLADGEVKAFDFEATTVGPAAPAEKPAQPVTTSDRSPLAYVFGGVGLAAIATGAVTGVMTIGAANDVRDHCTNGECDEEGLAAARLGKTTGIISPVAFAVGAVMLGVGAYLFFSTGSRPPSGVAFRF